MAYTKKDFLHKLSTKIVRESQLIVLEDLNVSGMVKNRKLSRAISLQGWREFRTLCEAKSEKFGRDFHIISRWEPTSQVCSDCGFKWDKLDLSIRSVVCLNCGSEHDRDENAAKNIQKVGMGHRHDSKWIGRAGKTTTVAPPDELSRITAAMPTAGYANSPVSMSINNVITAGEGRGDNMLENNNRWQNLKKIVLSCLIWGLVSSLWGCGDRIETSLPASGNSPVAISGLKQLKEVAPPATIQQLHQILEIKQPQVTILSPQPEQVLTDTQVAVKLQVTDLPIFQDEDLKLGSHLEVILDNQDAQSIYDLQKPLIFSNLAAGSHTIRVFASYPWHESFKNEGAYAQVTFHVFTKTINNKLDPKLPLLTYSSPAGSYGAEPILLDFYLTNAPLHMIALEDAEDEIPDWRIRVTINGETFVVDQWQPIYLKGWKQGNNWVQLEFIDEQGNVVENVYNNTAKIFTYKPGGQDNLSKLMRGNLSVAAAKGIINPTYEPPAPQPVPSPQITPSPSPNPIKSLVPRLQITPKVKVLEENKPTLTPDIKKLETKTLRESKSTPIPETEIPAPTITPSPKSSLEVKSLAEPAIAPPASPK